MRRAFALLIAASALAGRAEVVDRIAVSVAGQVVTMSDVRRQIRISAFLEKTEPDYSQTNLRHAAALLVDQVLIRREAELSRYPAAPNQEIESALDQFAESLGMDKPAMFAAALAIGFSEQEMRDQAAWRLTLLHFIDYRFRPGVQVGEADVANYYNNVFLPQFRKLSPEATPPASDAVRGQIIGILNTQLATEASQIWLEQTRKQTRIRYFEEAF
jgi:hypothetical protein